MASYSIDTAAVLQKLTETGMDPVQAKVIVEAIAESGEQVTTNSDLNALESRIKLQIYLIGGLVVVILNALEYLGV